MLDLSVSLSNRQRLRALKRLAIMDTSSEEAFDRLTRLVSIFLQVPVALVSLVDEDRQFFKSCVGLPEPLASARQTSLAYSFCQHAIHMGAPLIISDAREHPLVRDNPAILEFNVVAYAGIPLITSDGHALGTLCAIDGKPREWSDRDIAILTDLAASVMTELELRSALQEIARKADRIERLQAVTAALSEALTPSRVAAVVLEHGLSALEAKAGSMAVLCGEGEELEIVADLGYDPEYVQPYRRFSIDLPAPLADAVRNREPIFLDSPSMWDTYYPGVEVHTAAGGQAAAALPLVAGDSVLGALAFTFADTREFPQEDRTYMATLATQCAQALERARLYEATIEAQARAEESREQLEFILDASSTLAAAPNPRAALQSLADLIVASIADGCIIDILEGDDTIKRVTVVFADGDDHTVAQELFFDYPPRLDGKHPAGRVIRTNRPIRGEFDDRMLYMTTRNEEHFRLARGLGLTSYMCVPLAARDRAFGAVSVLSCSERHTYDDGDLALAQDLARRAAAVIDPERLIEAFREDCV